MDVTVYIRAVSVLDNDDSEAEVSLKDVLSFFTGAQQPPPLGFLPGTLRFNEDAKAEFPTASTCSLDLTLPTKHYQSPSLFNERLVYALKNHGGFGLL